MGAGARSCGEVLVDIEDKSCRSSPFVSSEIQVLQPSRRWGNADRRTTARTVLGQSLTEGR
jgi:hypothetical protein